MKDDATSLGRKALLLLTIAEGSASRGEPLEGRTKLQKLVFLLERESAEDVKEFIKPDPPYHFDAYRFGPFSKEILNDLDALRSVGLVKVNTAALDSQGKVVQFQFRLTESGARALHQYLTDHSPSPRLINTVREYGALGRREIVREIHDRYPELVSL